MKKTLLLFAFSAIALSCSDELTDYPTNTNSSQESTSDSNYMPLTNDPTAWYQSPYDYSSSSTFAPIRVDVINGTADVQFQLRLHLSNGYWDGSNNGTVTHPSIGSINISNPAYTSLFTGAEYGFIKYSSTIGINPDPLTLNNTVTFYDPSNPGLPINGANSFTLTGTAISPQAINFIRRFGKIFRVEYILRDSSSNSVIATGMMNNGDGKIDQYPAQWTNIINMFGNTAKANLLTNEIVYNNPTNDNDTQSFINPYTGNSYKIKFRTFLNRVEIMIY